MKIRITQAMPEGAEIDDLPTAGAAHLVSSGVAEEVTEETRPRGRKGKAAESDE